MVRPPSRTFKTAATEELIRTTIMEEIKRHAEAANLPKQYIDGLTLTLVEAGSGSQKWRIVNTWEGPRGEPLARWFEAGTKRFYPIRPRVLQPPKTKRQRERTPKYAKPSTGATLLHWERPKGQHHFRSQVIHPGQPRSDAMKDGFAAGKVLMRDERRLKRWFQDAYEDADVTRKKGKLVIKW